MNESQENMEEREEQAAQNSQNEPTPAPNELTDGQTEENVLDRLKEAEKQLESTKDLLLRKVAEFDNYKKRVENEATSIARYGKIDVIQSLLPVIDDFERSLKLSKDGRETEAFVKGVELIYQKLMKFLDLHGVKPLDALGKEFDVHYHDALLQVPRTDVPPHMVIEVVEKGYMINDRILRHAKVVVSSSPAEQGDDGGGSETTTDQSRVSPSPKQEN